MSAPRDSTPPAVPTPPSGLIGVVHLPPLPGDPKTRAQRATQPVQPGSPAADSTAPGPAWLEAALRDAEALTTGGADALLVENFGSAPFAKGTRTDPAPAHHVAALAIAVHALRTRSDLPVGVNCLRNDARAALGIARVTGAAFVRVNVLCGAYVTDQGILEGDAHGVLGERARLGADGVALCADVLVKHAAPLTPIDPVQAAEECAGRGGADALILTGRATGAPVDQDTLSAVAEALPETPLLIGSGLTEASAPQLAPRCHGAIVGTWLKRGGRLHAPVDPDRVRQLAAACAGRFRKLPT